LDTLYQIVPTITRQQIINGFDVTATPFIQRKCLVMLCIHQVVIIHRNKVRNKRPSPEGHTDFFPDALNHFVNSPTWRFKGAHQSVRKPLIEGKHHESEAFATILLSSLDSRGRQGRCIEFEEARDWLIWTEFLIRTTALRIARQLPVNPRHQGVSDGFPLQSGVGGNSPRRMQDENPTSEKMRLRTNRMQRKCESMNFF
jgi:hypothetical protein